MSTLAPFKVEDIVRDVNPFLTDVLSVVEFFVNSARFVFELCASRPRCSKGPRALSRVEEELLNFFT